MIRRATRLALVLFAVGHISTMGSLCVFGRDSERFSTLREDAAEAKILLYCKMESAGSPDLVINKSLKYDSAIEGRTSITLPSHLRLRDAKVAANYLVFGDVGNGGQLDFYRAMPGTRTLSDYVQGLLTIDVKDRGKLLKFCFDYLDSADAFVAKDAFAEFISSTAHHPMIQTNGRFLWALVAAALRC